MLEEEIMSKVKVSKSGNRDFDWCLTDEDGGSMCHFTRWGTAKAHADRMATLWNLFIYIENPVEWVRDVVCLQPTNVTARNELLRQSLETFHMEHELKTVKPFFQNIVDLLKTFEIRKNDRNFKVGDTLILKEWNEKEQCFERDREVKRVITYICDYEQKEGYVVLGMEPIDD